MEANNRDEDSPGRTSQMLMQMISQMSEQLQNMQASQQALRAEREMDREETRSQIRAMQSAIATPAATPHPPAPTITEPEPRCSIPRETAPAKRKPTLPDPQRFDGSRRKFRAWQLEMQSKLRVDGPALGGPPDQFAYIYARLDQTPQAMAAAFFEKGGPDGRFDPSQFMQYLTGCYGDPNVEQRVLARLEAMRQGDKESFASFLPKFERELADSGGASWGDPVRINSLKRVINQELRTHLAGQLNLPKEYPGFVNALQNLGANLEDLHFHSRKQANGQRQQRNSSPARQQTKSERSVERPSPDRMDWEPTKVGKHGSRGTQERKIGVHWAKEERRCFRCDRAGHIAAYCTRRPREQPGERSERPVGKAEHPQQRTKAAKSIRDCLRQWVGKQVAPGKNRRQEHQQALIEWRQFEDKMDSPPMYANIGINREYYSKVFIDCGCLCYGTVNETFVRKLRLPRIPIRPRTLDQISTSLYGAIRGVTYADIDIDGYRKNRVFFYIIPGQDDEVVLGRTWMNQEDVTLYPSKGLLHIGSQDHWVKERDPNRTERYELSGQSAATFAGLVRRARKENEKEGKRDQRGLRVFSASMADIEKALAPKKRTDARERLPTHYHEYLAVFDRDEADRLPPHRPGSDHRIVLEKDANGREKDAPWGPLYGMSREELIVLRRTLTELLDKGFIRASSSPASAPVLFVRKPGGGLRFCVDYRGLNAITKKDRYPLPLIEETLRSLSKAKWLTKLDVIAAFHKVRVVEGDEWKTAFRTRYGLYEWLVTPFGLTGAPATFQRYINHTLREFLDEFCSAYIDDILIYSSGSLADHRKKVKQVLARLRDAGLQIDIDKCEFEATSVKYLGFIVEAGKGIRVDPEKVRAIQEWEAPRSARAVRSFLGFANYYRQFIPKFSNIASPLTVLTKKDAAFAWSKECQAAFNELKVRLISAPVLAQWDPDRETIVETDSSGYVTGGALSQKGDDGLMRPVAFFSKKCTPAECNYPIHDKELLAIMRCLEHWDAELRSVESFTVLTDHLNLRYFTKKQPLSERQARWAEMLSRYNFTIVHRPGKDAAVPDALSRREQDMPHSAEDERLRGRRIQLLEPAKGGGLVTRVKSGYISKGDTDQPGDATAEQDESVENPFTEPEIQELWKEGLKQHNRYWLIRNAVQEGERRLPSQWGLPVMLSECSIDEGQRLCWRERIWVPNHEPLRTRLMQDTHDSALAGHPGRDMLKSLLARRFYWPGLDADARQFVRNCDACGRSNVWREKRRGLLKPLPVPERIWSELSIDFVTELPPTKSNGSTNMMVLTDRLSKSVVLESLKDITAETTARALMRNVLQHHGIPAAIVTDRGTQFTSRMWKRLCELLRIKQRLSTAWHPETDGATERANQEVERYIRIFTTYAQDDWDELLPAAAMALNNRTATSTGLSPFFFTHGYHLEPVQVKEALRPDGKSPVAKAEGIVRRFQEATEWAQAAMASAQERQEDNANTRRQPSDQYKPGDKVWLRLRNIRSKRPSKKLDWLAGKYTVLETVGSHACRLDTPPGVHNVFHVSLLRLAADDPLPSQTSDDYRPPAILTDDGELWEVEEICGHKKVGREWKVLVKWVGWVGPTWEPVRFLSDTTALAQYEAMHGKIESAEAPRKGRRRRGVL
ncbi:retrovirus polyprotein [Purpureocillium lavendulum]|uniref:Retrovirus polyprotein n=1 Tax=Purpureocillium lavendulum TaxID=1247861 RepID=A0AB34FDB4_9HYPO|nr:retrovirus polyprotein [Purpureocillium lavendulum]